MPKFPYQRTLRDDLAELWRIERYRSGARPAGLTSISATEGSLDLIDDTGATVARYGDMPGDKFGIGIPHGGDWVTVQEYVAIRLGPLTDRMGSAESRLDTHSQHLATHDSQLGAIGNRLNGHDNDIDAIEDLLGDLADQIGDIAGDTSSIQNTLGNLSDAISTLAGNVATNGARIVILGAIVKNLASRLDDLDGGSTGPLPPWMT